MPTTQCTQISFAFHPDWPIEVKADAPHTSSDGGVLLLRQADERHSISRWFAACLPDERRRDRVRHSRLEQIRQRLYQIALGYEDCNDADHLRDDPVLKTACDRDPDGADGLSSQPTLSRLENGVDGRTLRALVRSFEQAYVEALSRTTSLVVLDIDPTDDPTHGQQQLTFFHGFYDQHMYHPLLVFDAQSGQLVSALLRPGNAHAARGAAVVLRRLVRAIKARCPHAHVVVRADSGFCVPRVVSCLEELDRELGEVDYVIGIARNPRLLALAQPALQAAREQYEATGAHVRYFTTMRYAAETWPHERHVVVKAEHHTKGANPRFVLTSLVEVAPQLLYDVVYCARGQCENLIKDFKNALHGDRLSCSKYTANFFRLLLHAGAYRLMHAVRGAVASVSVELGTAQFDTLRLRLLKVAAQVTRSVRRLLVRLPRVFPWARVFAEAAWRLGAPAPA